MYNAAKAGNKVTFDQHMEPMKGINETAYSKLLGTPHEAWANYAGRNNVIWDQTTSNFSESLNNMIGDVVSNYVGTFGSFWIYGVCLIRPLGGRAGMRQPIT